MPSPVSSNRMTRPTKLMQLAPIITSSIALLRDIQFFSSHAAPFRLVCNNLCRAKSIGEIIAHAGRFPPFVGA